MNGVCSTVWAILWPELEFRVSLWNIYFKKESIVWRWLSGHTVLALNLVTCKIHCIPCGTQCSTAKSSVWRASMRGVELKKDSYDSHWVWSSAASRGSSELWEIFMLIQKVELVGHRCRYVDLSHKLKWKKKVWKWEGQAANTFTFFTFFFLLDLNLLTRWL